MKILKRLLVAILLMLPFLAGAQSPARDFDTTFLTNLGTTFNARVHVPAGYYSQPTWKWDGIIYFVGLGEIGTDTNLISHTGPTNYLKSGWDGGVQINASQRHFPVIVTLQEPGFYHPQQMERVVDSVITNLHMFPGNVHLCGISLGSQVANQFVMYQNVNGVSLYGGKVRSIVNVIGEKPDQYGTGLVYAACFAGWAGTGGREAAFEQAFDGRDLKTIVDTLNHTLNKSFYFQTNYGGGGHCCWQFEYGDSTGLVPLTYNFGGRTQNVYQWMVTQGLDTTATYHIAGGNTPPTGSGGPKQAITLPTTSVTLAGTAAGTGGATISSTLWSIPVNPGAAVVTNPTSLTSGVTGLSTRGNYVFRMIIVDNNNLKDTVYTTVNVIPACNLNAPRKIRLTLTQNSPGEIFRPTTAQTSTGALGGDTLVIPYNNGIPYDIISLGEISGDPCNPIVITADSAVVISGKFVVAAHSQYLKFDFKNNLTIHGAGGDGWDGLLFNHIEICNLTIRNVPNGAGMLMKTVEDTSKIETLYPNYLMDGLYIHDIVVDSTQGNSLYIGPTNPSGDDGGQPPGVPNRMKNVRISHITSLRAGQTGISLSGAGDGCSIDSNTISLAGMGNTGSFFSVGIEFGGSTKGNIFNNTLTNIAANGIQIFGYDTIQIYNNILDNCGNNLGGSGHETILLNDPLDHIVSNPGMRPLIYNNIIKNPYPGVAAIHAYNGNGTMFAANVHDNQFCIPGANPLTWQATYLNFAPAATLTNNTLITCGIVIPIDYFKKKIGTKLRFVNN